MTSEYQITVITGIRKGAGTDASVSLVIKGNAKHIFTPGMSRYFSHFSDYFEMERNFKIIVF